MSDSAKKWKIYAYLTHDASKDVSVTVSANGKKKALELAEKKLGKLYPNQRIVIRSMEQLTDNDNF